MAVQDRPSLGKNLPVGTQNHLSSLSTGKQIHHLATYIAHPALPKFILGYRMVQEIVRKSIIQSVKHV